MSLELTPSALLTKLHFLIPSTAPAKKKPANKTSEINILVAYSGGLDSHVLLHCLSQISGDELKLRAIYINHGLQAVADDWAAHCKNTCQNLDVAFRSINLNLSLIKGESVEELARNARYKVLLDNLENDEILLTAHHQNDQAETLLLQLFRGAGVQGLAAMPESNEFDAQGKPYLHLRPLLAYSREALEAYAKQHNLKHIEDPTNKDTAFDRNYLRQNIMPLLRERWLGIDKTISRAASIQGETKTLLDEFAVQELESILSTNGFTETDESILAPIDITKLRKHSLPKQRLLMRFWITRQGFNNPSDKKLAHVFSDLIEAAADKQPLIEWKGAELRRYQQQLYIMSPLSEHDAAQVFVWQLDSPLEIASLSLTLDAKQLELKETSTNEKLIVKFRQGGEKIELPKRGKISLKNLFQEQQIPPWMRSRLPLLYKGNQLIKIIGLKDPIKDYKRHPPTF